MLKFVSMTPLNQIKKDLRELANPEKALILQRFFKTGKGQYGEGDQFLGITVPEQRRIAKRYVDIHLQDLKKLLASNLHEQRLTALLLLVHKYQKADDANKKEIVAFYLKNTDSVNNWDLVDLSSDKILGSYLLDKDKSILYKLAESQNLWERRIAILATFNFIKNNSFQDTLKISEILLYDDHDLIHKAVGWMLREITKRDQKTGETFLRKHYKKMPRTMLRYAIERFDEKKRKSYLKNLV